jgi:hypothetical protein
MRKTLAFLVALLGVSLVASVAAAAPNKAVTIKAARPVVVYGSSVTLSGKVSMPQSGQKVDVLAEPFGTTSPTPLATVETTNGGQWTFMAKPTIQTMYEAQWKGETSSNVDVKVRPAIKLTLVSTHGSVGTFSTTVTAARSFAGKFVLVQRLASTGATTLRKVTLDSSSTATFKVRMHRGSSQLRVVMPTSQAAPGYIAGFSNVLTISR